MFVLLDIEWVGEGQITQLSALRTDGKWNALDRFDALAAPAGPELPEPDSVAFHGYPAEDFLSAEPEGEVIRRFAAWLREDDALLVWHYQAETVFKKAWREELGPEGRPKVKWLRDRLLADYGEAYGLRGDVYEMARALGVPVTLPKHCARNDTEALRGLLAALRVPTEQPARQAAAKRETPPAPARKEAPTLAERNRRILDAVTYQYVFSPRSGVFHTRSCPRMLRVRDIQGCVYYRNAAKDRRPCLICKPLPEERDLVENIEHGKGDQVAREPEEPKSFRQVRLVNGDHRVLKADSVIGFCHYRLHPGHLTKRLLDEHQCLEKACRYLERYPEKPYWRELRGRAAEKEERKAKKKHTKARQREDREVMDALLEHLRSCAEAADEGMEVVRVQREDLCFYTVFYVSDNRFADGDRFPYFTGMLHTAYPDWRFRFRHIRDIDGHFVTREEYARRKK